ncbi:MAG: ATPase P, partial [Parachlamydia sp.]|nr:ATPase P [Parachlamydia sp.]
MSGKTASCELCQTPVGAYPYQNDDFSFCCAGCLAVYQILSSSQALENFNEHPLFKQAVQSGLISNPDLLEEINKKTVETDKEVEKLFLEINGMWCPSCAQVIYLSLMKEKGIKHCRIDYATDFTTIEYPPCYLSKEKALKVTEGLGIGASSMMTEPAKDKGLYLRIGVAAFFSMNVMMFAYPVYASYYFDEGLKYSKLFAWLSFFASLPVLFYCAWPIWKKFFHAVRFRVWGMESLVAVGVAAATALSVYELFQESLHVYFDSMTVIILFVLWGKAIESKAKRGAKEAFMQLIYALPRRGRKKFLDGKEKFVPIKEIYPGDSLVVLSGEQIVLDGIVRDGEGLCDAPLMTGESMPVSKKINEKVLAGSVLQKGHFVIEVQAKADETALFHIVQVLEKVMGQKSPYVRSADRLMH